jgi:hypothetical protein
LIGGIGVVGHVFTTELQDWVDREMIGRKSAA